MENRVRKLFLWLIQAVSVLGAAYALALFTGRRISGLHALFLMQMAAMSALWFAFHLGETRDVWPVSIRATNESAPVEQANRGDRGDDRR